MQYDSQQLRTFQDLRHFIAGPELEPVSTHDGNRLIKETLRQFGYAKLSKANKGLIRGYLMKATGRSRATITRRIRQFCDTGEVRDRRGAPGKPFWRLYTDRDIRLLAEAARTHEDPSGPALLYTCRRLYEEFGRTEYERLAKLSSSHLYRLRKDRTYQARRRDVKPTRSVKAPRIGERRKPRPDRRPGYLRVDTVHQGDLLELRGCKPLKGVYYLNAVDEFTQWEAVLAVPALRMDVVQQALEYIVDVSFPFRILGFHSDNGSEFVNRATEELLRARGIDFTRSRPRHSNDNGLVESKNASVVRKNFGYGHISPAFYQDISDFTTGALAEYVNFHRPCWFPSWWTDRKGRVSSKYLQKDIRTPYKKLCLVPNMESFLRPDVTRELLDHLSRLRDPNQAAEQMQRERSKLFEAIRRDTPRAAA